MKNILKYIACAFAVVSLAGCSNDEFISSSTLADGEGALSLKFTIGEASKATLTSSDDVNKVLENCAVRIYTQDDQGNFGTGGMIRKYLSQDEVPDNIYLATGKYGVTVDAGKESKATFDELERTYKGATPFEIISGSAQQVNVACKLRNSVVQVVYDQTLIDKFDTYKGCTVALSDTYNAEDVKDGKVPFLEFGNDPELGYFLISEDATTLSWCFKGESTSNDLTVEGGAKSLTANGVIENIEEGHLYTLNLKYEKTPDGNGAISVSVDTSEEFYEDEFSFALQPSISANEFNVTKDTPIYRGGSYTFNISSTTDISYIEVTGENGQIFKPFENSAIVDLSANGIKYEGSALKGLLTLNETFFNSYATGGARAIKINVVDTKGVKGIANITTMLQGVTTNVTDVDLWHNKATFSAYVAEENPTSVVIKYRNINSATWTTLETTASGDGFYTAKVSPTWSTSSNDDGKINVYTLASGITANNTFECKLEVNGVEVSRVLSYTTQGVQAIPYGDMEDSGMSCFTSNNSSSISWASGNNNTTGSLCKQGTYAGMGGSYCAKLQATSAFNVLAAGNLVFGTFGMTGLTTGAVRFGQSFNWTSRPKSLRLKYAATIGTVNKNGQGLSAGQKDIARIYAAIVDWNGRHKVEAGLGEPSGCWDPATQNSTAEGKVIGYASLKFSNDVSPMKTVDLDFKYYDTATKPSGKYTLVISCATSNFGDYGIGSTSSTMYVDDFEFVY